MATKPLTDARIRKLPLPATRITIPDGVVPGLYLRMSPNGSRSWILQYRVGSQPQRKMTLGNWPEIDCETARQMARDARGMAQQGIDPVEARKAAERAKADAVTVAQLAEAHISRYIERPGQLRASSAAERTRLLRRELVPALGTTKARDVTTRDIRDMLHAIATRPDKRKGRSKVGSPIQANRVRAACHKLWQWGIDHEMVDSNPVTRAEQYKAVRRDRVLSDAEIATVWRAAGTLSSTSCALVRLLLLTGCRLKEIAHLRWSERTGDDKFQIDAKRMKAGVAHLVSLSTQARAIVDGRQQYKGCDLVLTNDAKTPLNSWSDIKRAVDKATGPLPHWTLHDLRRTCATGMRGIGVDLATVMACLAHAPSAVMGAAHAAYDRYSMEPEKKEAWQTWADHVENLASTFVPMQKQAD